MLVGRSFRLCFGTLLKRTYRVVSDSVRYSPSVGIEIQKVSSTRSGLLHEGIKEFVPKISSKHCQDVHQGREVSWLVISR